MKNEGDGTDLGMVTSRRCPYCGHSEIGYTSPNGTFHPLEPGTLIRVLRSTEVLSPDIEGRPVSDDLPAEEEPDQGEFQPWVPTALRGDRKLRVKYGVMVGERVALSGVTANDYRSAFLRKIEKLIEKGSPTPLPVVFDKFFSTPHLASGDPRQISRAMWRDLEEVRAPALAVMQWIDRQDQETLLRMIHPKPIGDLGREPASDSDLGAELQSLTLEQFLEML